MKLAIGSCEFVPELLEFAELHGGASGQDNRVLAPIRKLFAVLERRDLSTAVEMNKRLYDPLSVTLTHRCHHSDHLLHQRSLRLMSPVGRHADVASSLQLNEYCRLRSHLFDEVLPLARRRDSSSRSRLTTSAGPL